jgi:hypothetical protein
MKKTLVITALLGAMLFAACQNKTKQAETKETAEEAPVVMAATNHTFSDVAPATAAMMKDLFAHYTHLKNGMVNTNANEAKAGATALLKVIAAFDSTGLTSEQLKVYSANMGAIKEDAGYIMSTTDIGHQREHMVSLSNNMYAMVKAFGAGKEVYYEFCPMANKSEGAYWLSEEGKIRNPYFGSEMMECGEVTEVVK